MKNEGVKDEVIIEAMKTLKALVMELAYGDGEDDDFDTIVAINAIIEIVESEVSTIESERDRQKNQATILRKRLGDDLDRMCDTLGIN